MLAAHLSQCPVAFFPGLGLDSVATLRVNLHPLAIERDAQPYTFVFTMGQPVIRMRVQSMMNVKSEECAIVFDGKTMGKMQQDARIQPSAVCDGYTCIFQRFLQGKRYGSICVFHTKNARQNGFPRAIKFFFDSRIMQNNRLYLACSLSLN